MTLTDEQLKEYVESGYSCCPNPDCKSTNLNCVKENMDGNWMTRDFECADCGVEWRDVYTLTSAERIER